jgi:hypothetical protein
MYSDEKPKRQQRKRVNGLRPLIILIPIIAAGLFFFQSTQMTYNSIGVVRSSLISANFVERTQEVDPFLLTATALVQEATRDVLELTAELEARTTANGIFITFTPSPIREVRVPLALVINGNALRLQIGDVVEVVWGEENTLSTISATFISIDGQVVTLTLPSNQAQLVEGFVASEERIYIAVTQ